MAEYQHIVDEIKAYLASPGQLGHAELEPLAKEYAGLCREANDRLRECQDYLRKGLRSEAIHLAEKHPTLLDVISALDFAELPEWRAACTNLKLTAPPPLLNDAAQSLSDAYSEEMPLQSMLTAHRMLNLAQAPLSPRIKILRKIIAADPATLYWGDDLEALERLRLPEIESQARAAEARGELGTLESLVAEIRDTNWHTTIPAPFKKTIESCFDRLTHKVGEQMLRSMLPSLDAAYSAMNINDCISLLSKWDHIVKVCKQKLPADLLERGENVRAWLAQENDKAEKLAQFEGACASLEAALDGDSPTLELERLFLATNRFALDVPPELEGRYRQRVAARTVTTRRRHYVTLAAIAAVVVVVLGFAGVLYYRSTYNANLRQWVGTLKDAELAVTTQGDLSRGIAVKESVRKEAIRFMADPEVVAEMARLEVTILSETQRDSAFKAKVVQLQAGDTLDAATMQLALAQALRPDEKATLQLIQDKFDQARETKQRNADDHFIQDAQALQKRMDKAFKPDALQNDREEYLRELSACEAILSELDVRQGVTSSTRQSEIKVLSAMLERAKSNRTMAETEESKIRKVAQSQSSDDLKAALDDYLKSLPTGAKSEAFAAARRRVQSDADVEAWDWLSNSARWPDFSPNSSSHAETRLKEIESYSKSHPQSPLLPAIAAYKDFIKRGIDAAGPEGTWKRDLDRQLSGDFYSKMYVVETTTGKTYFTPEKINFQTDTIGSALSVYLTPDLTTATKVELAKDETTKLQPPPTIAPKSPQMLASEKIRASIRDMSFERWPFVGLDAFETFESSKSHEVLRASTLLRITQLNQETLEWAIGDKLKPAIKGLTDLKLSEMHWVNPDDQVSSQTLSAIASAVKRIPPTSDLRKMVEAQVSGMKRKVSLGFIGRGCLIGLPREPIGISTSIKAEDGLVAYALRSKLPQNADDPLLLPVAHAVGGKWVLDPPSVDKPPEGTLLYIAPGN